MNSKKVLLTGASEGIGRALAKVLIQAGDTVTGVARNEARLRELVSEHGEARFRAFPADLSTSAGLEAVAAELRGGAYDVLINNAGFGALGEFTSVSIEKQREMIRLNVEALTVLSHAFLSGAKRGDALVNVSSVIGLVPAPGQPVYSATKAYVTFFSECLAAQYASKGIYVVALCPGSTESKFAERAGVSDHKIPPALVESAEDVARHTLEALEARRSPVVISGKLNVAFVAAARLVPRRLTNNILARARPRTATSPA